MEIPREPGESINRSKPVEKPLVDDRPSGPKKAMPLRSRKPRLRGTVGNPPVFSGWVVHIKNASRRRLFFRKKSGRSDFMVSTTGPTASTTGNEGQVETGRDSSTEGEEGEAGSGCNMDGTHASSSRPDGRPCVPERALDESVHGSGSNLGHVRHRNSRNPQSDSNPRWP